jgi:hypothetical protein
MGNGSLAACVTGTGPCARAGEPEPRHIKSKPTNTTGASIDSEHKPTRHEHTKRAMNVPTSVSDL